MQRDKAIDISKAIGIILMLIGHSAILTENWTNFLFKGIFSFHMPLFFIFAGYLHKKTDIKTRVKKDLRSLVLPYFATVVIGCTIVAFLSFGDLFICIKGAFIGTVGNISSKYYNQWPIQVGPVWFLLSLFWCRLCYCILSNHSRIPLMLSILLSFFFSYCGRMYCNIPLCIGSGFSILIFYSIGVELRERGLNNMLKYQWILFLIWVYSINTCFLNTAQYIYTSYPTCILGALGGTLFVYNISKRIKIGLFYSFFSFIGEHTKMILCAHGVAYLSKRSILLYLELEDNTINDDLAYFILTFIFVMLYFLFSFCLNKILPLTKNEKNTYLG